MSIWVGHYKPLELFVCGPKFTNFLSPNVEGVVVDEVFTVRCYALHGLSYRNSVRLSVGLSVRLSGTLVHCVHTVRPTIMISSPYGSPFILVSGDITFIPKFEGGLPSEGVE